MMGAPIINARESLGMCTSLLNFVNNKEIKAGRNISESAGQIHQLQISGQARTVPILQIRKLELGGGRGGGGAGEE